MGCALLYSVPHLWRFYHVSLYPRILPWVLPVVQVSRRGGGGGGPQPLPDGTLKLSDRACVARKRKKRKKENT